MSVQHVSAAPARYDIYAPVHKGLRMALSKLLVRLGAHDFRDEAATAALLADLRAQLFLSGSHLKHEDNHFQAAVEAATADGATRLMGQHDHHRDSFDELERLMAAVEQASPEKRFAAGHALYLAFGRFVAEDFEHMADEETKILPILQARHSDQELMEMEGRLIASIPPDVVMQFWKIMIPAMNQQDRVSMLGFVKKNAPTEAFQAIIDVAARPALSEAELRELLTELDAA